MGRPYILLVLLLVVAYVVPDKSTAQSDSALGATASQDVFGRVSPSVYVIEGLNEAGDVVSIASAVAVGKNELLTNKHAVIEGASLRIRQDGKVWPATVEKLDETADLSLLRVDDLNDPVLPPIRSSDSFKVGERVFAVGAPLGLELSLSDGLVAGIRRDRDITLVQTTAPISKGSSGGGLFDAHGELIGITSFYLAGGQNLNFAIAADRLSALRQQTAEAGGRAWREIAEKITDKADSSAGVEPQPCLDMLDASCAGRLNEWAEQSRSHLAGANKERRRAMRAYDEALRFNPTDATVWVKLGTLCAKLEDRQRMQNAFDEALRLRPNDIAILTTFAEGYDRLNDRAEAVRVFRHAVDLQPGNPDLWLGLANVLTTTDKTETIRALHQAEILSPPSANLWARIGLKYQFLNRYPNAEAAFQQALRLEPSNVFNLALLGNLYGMRHDNRKFREVCGRLRQIDPHAADNLERAWR